MRPTQEYIDTVLAAPLIEAVAPHLSSSARQLHHGAESLAGLFHVPADVDHPIIPGHLTNGPYRGLVQRALPSGMVGSIALIWDGGTGGPDPTSAVWAIVATRDGPLRAVRRDGSVDVVDFDQIHPKAAVIAALLWRSMGREVEPPTVPVLRPMLAHIWARACNARMRRNGALLGVVEAMAIDPLNDPPPLARCKDDLAAFYRCLAESKASYWVRNPDGQPGPMNLADHIPWVDLGALGWVLRDTARPPALIGAALRRCLDDAAFEAVTAAMTERGWVATPKTHAEALAIADDQRRGRNPFDAPEPLFTAGTLDQLDDGGLAGAVIGAYQRRQAKLRVPAVAGQVPPVGAVAFLAAYAWSDSPSGDRLNSVDLEQTPTEGLGGDPAHSVALVDQAVIDYQAPLAGLGRWRVPTGADGVAFVVRNAPSVEECEGHILDSSTAARTVVTPTPAPHDVLVVAVDRRGGVAVGRLEDDLVDRHFGSFDPNPRPQRQRRLFLRSVHGLAALASLPTAGLAAAVGRRLLSGELLGHDHPPVPEAIGQYLASVWSGSLVEAAGALGERLDGPVVRTLDPLCASELAPVFADGPPTWDSIAATPAINPLSPPDAAPDRTRHVAALGPLLHPGVLGWACAVLSWDRTRIVRGVQTACGPAAADDVLAQMASRSWLPTSIGDHPHFP